MSVLPVALGRGVTRAFQERRFGHLMHGGPVREEGGTVLGVAVR